MQILYVIFYFKSRLYRFSVHTYKKADFILITNWLEISHLDLGKIKLYFSTMYNAYLFYKLNMIYQCTWLNCDASHL
jgi:hypothetical protein